VGRGRLAVALVVAGVAGACTRGDVAQWRGRSMGTLVAAPGLSLEDVQRRSTVKLSHIHEGTYGSSGVFFDFEVEGQGLRFPGCNLYNVDTREGRVTTLHVTSVREPWPALTAALTDTAARMQELGWQRRFTLSELGDWRSKEARQVGTSSSGTVAAFQWTKGDLLLGFGIARKWSPIPFWRRANQAPWFWHTVYLKRLDAEDRRALDAHAPADP
jgi:hypothetical protein